MKNRVTSPGLAAMNRKVCCKFCNKETTLGNLKKHEGVCYLNPSNIVECEVCSKPIKNYKVSKGTCSRSCANKHFRSGEENGNWKGAKYQTICFLHHKKECVVCKETNIVAVHHYDCNHDNNEPSNLVPLCPTHHSYMHSRYKREIEHIVDKYVKKFNESFSV